MIRGWENSQNDDIESGDYPFVFELVDKSVYGNLDTPFVNEVTLSAFAHELTIYDSEEENDAKQTDEPKFAVESFTPSGFYAGEESEDTTLQLFTIFYR